MSRSVSDLEQLRQLQLKASLGNNPIDDALPINYPEGSESIVNEWPQLAPLFNMAAESQLMVFTTWKGHTGGHATTTSLVRVGEKLHFLLVIDCVLRFTYGLYTIEEKMSIPDALEKLKTRETWTVSTDFFILNFCPHHGITSMKEF